MRRGHVEDRAAQAGKVVDGGNAKASPRRVKENPREQKLRKGAGGSWAKPLRYVAHSDTRMKALKAARERNDKRARGERRARTAVCEGQALGERTLDVVVG
jgi:hypothetical protein